MNNIDFAEKLRENREIKIKIKIVDDKIKAKQQKALIKKQMQEYRETLQYRIYQMFNFIQPKTEYQCHIESLCPEERELLNMRHQAEHFHSEMTSNEEQLRIRKAKKLWQTVRRKRRVILMMSKLGEGAIIELDSRRLKELIKDEDE